MTIDEATLGESDRCQWSRNATRPASPSGTCNREGYTSTSVRLAIDAAGLVRQSTTTLQFADGGAVVATRTFSDFGCGDPIVFPEMLDPNAESCTPPPTSPSTT